MKPTRQTPDGFRHVERFAAEGDESDVTTISFARPPSDKFPGRCHGRFHAAQSKVGFLVDAVPFDADRNGRPGRHKAFPVVVVDVRPSRQLVESYPRGAAIA